MLQIAAETGVAFLLLVLLVFAAVRFYADWMFRFFKISLINIEVFISIKFFHVNSPEWKSSICSLTEICSSEMYRAVFTSCPHTCNQIRSDSHKPSVTLIL